MVRKRWTACLALALIAAAVPAAAVAQPAPGDAQPPLTAEEPAAADEALRVTTAVDAAREKIDEALAERVEGAPRGSRLEFVARIRPGTDLSAYADAWFARPFVDPLGTTVAVGRATPAGIEKLATLPGVLRLRPPESTVRPQQVVDPDVERAVDDAVAARVGGFDGDAPPAAPATPATEPARPGNEPQGWYHTGPELHRSEQAWAKGYTGDGVLHMSNDSGADYCHPDLLDTYAYVDDDASPYDGLPLMFDSYSAFLAARDHYLGEDNVAAGRADYADTSTVVDGPPVVPAPPGAPSRAPDAFGAAFQPIGAPEARVYTLPRTSRSGEYHLGSHPDKALAAQATVIAEALSDAETQPAEGERAGVLVTDETTDGVYDTVYVDLDYDYDFTDETPARLDREPDRDEVACLDHDGDGLNDVSGGLVYFVSDGTTPVPTLDWFWGIPGDAYGNGDLVAFHVLDYTEGGGDHGMGTTSSAVGQGVVTGSVIEGPDGLSYHDGGLVVGPGRDVASTQNGDFYLSPFVEDGFVFAALGYDAVAGTGDDTQVITNSWGDSAPPNDGWDLDSRLIDAVIRTLNPTLASLHSTGNGAAGYGTVAPPSPSSGIGVGASTEFGSTGQFETITAASQIVGGDVMSWSNRGPGAVNTVGADVVATGAFGAGAVPLNAVLTGSVATASFGGTSQAAPVAGGNLALIYDAWRQRTGTWPDFRQARELLMGSARHVDHDVFSQGAGIVDADAGTDAAAGGAPYVSPASWSVGDWRGEEYPAFANVIEPGGSDTQVLTMPNHGDEPLVVDVGTAQFSLIDETLEYSFTSNPVEDDHGEFTVPDYAFRIDRDIPEGTDLLQVRVTKPYEQFDPDGDLDPDTEEGEGFNNWRVHLQNWTDLDGDGEFWVDADGDGKVDADGEMESGEHLRFTYGYNTGPTQQARMANPLERIDDGLLLTFRHRDVVESVETTDLTVELSFWRQEPWRWVDLGAETATAGPVPGVPAPETTTVVVPPGGTAELPVTLTVPGDTPYGMYEGAIVVAARGGVTSAVPVTVPVAATGTSFAYGGIDEQDALYDNGRVYGYTDYAWREESGDWRFFWTDVREEDLPGTGTATTAYLVTDTSWEGDGDDLDTILLGPEEDVGVREALDDAEIAGPGEDVFGPYTLGVVGRSPDTYIGSGRYRYDTSSGGPRDLVAAPARAGLHGVLLHHVKVDGERLDTPFSGRTGLVTVDAGALAETVTAAEPTGSVDVTVDTELDFDGFTAEGYGLSAPRVETGTVQQDDPADPSTASFTTTVTAEDAALLEVATGGAAGSDLDLYVYGPDGELVGTSTTPTDEEFVSVLLPDDGEYTIAVQGWSVPAGETEFSLSVLLVQGDDVTVDGAPDALAAGETTTVTVSYDASGKDPGVYGGYVFMGPEAAPALLRIPITVVVPEEDEEDEEDGVGDGAGDDGG